MKPIWTSQASWQQCIMAMLYPNLPLSCSSLLADFAMPAAMLPSQPPQSPSATTTLLSYRVSAHQQQNFGNWTCDSPPPPSMPMLPLVVPPPLTLWCLLMRPSSAQPSPPWRRHSGRAMSLNLPDSLCQHFTSTLPSLRPLSKVTWIKPEKTSAPPSVPHQPWSLLLPMSCLLMMMPFPCN